VKVLRELLERLVGAQARHAVPADRLYGAAVAQARNPAFYVECRVPDTLDGRFDLIVLHLCLLIRRLRREGETGATLAQALFDTTFDDMDRSLREMGVGDLGVGRRVKAMASAFYGRATA
jgi:cytochrome b pre-mRNA-processing protein 3